MEYPEQNFSEIPETNPEPTPESQPVRKPSPFADGPYTTGYQPRQTAGQGSVPPVPPVPPQRPKKAGRSPWRGIASICLTVALVAAGCGITAFSVNRRWEAWTQSMTSSFNRQIGELQQQIAAASNPTVIAGSAVSAEGMTPGQVYAQNVNSVVSIVSESTSNYGTSRSSGSGFILTEDGYIVSNYHVVSGAQKLTVTMADGEEYDAKLIGYDDRNDVSLLKVEAQGLRCVTIGSSDQLKIGDPVVAIGNPLGTLTLSQSVGYISGKDRDVTTDGTVINMLQLDASINSGNSGGPLFNMQGQVVGITTAKYSGTTSSGASIEGIGFAIPIDDVIGLIEDLQNYGYVTGAYLGVMVSNVEESAISMYGVPQGAYVSEVTPGYCAEQAGLQVKDIITALGNTKVTNVTELTRALRKFKAGDETTITVNRGGRDLTLNITLSERPHEEQPAQPQQGSGDMPDSGNYEEWFNYFAPFFGFGGKG